MSLRPLPLRKVRCRAVEADVRGGRAAHHHDRECARAAHSRRCTQRSRWVASTHSPAAFASLMRRPATRRRALSVAELRSKCLHFIVSNFDEVSKTKVRAFPPLPRRGASHPRASQAFEEMGRRNVDLVFEVLRHR